MISGLRGFLYDVSLESVILDVQGVFYEAFCSSTVIGELSQKKRCDSPIFLHTYLHVREDQTQLFGFLSRSEKALFLNLLKVSGIGPKSALHILSGASVTQILHWIETRDVKALCQLPKLGKKTAEQLILTLRGQLVLEEEDFVLKKNLTKAQQPLVSALVNLGFRLQEVEKVVSELPDDLDFQEGLRRGLKDLSSL
jgi:holliday junction DNA helicase RuvA